MDAIKVLGQLLGNNATGGNLLGSLLQGDGGGSQRSPQSGGAADLLRGLVGAGSSGRQSSGGGLLGSLMGGGGSAGGRAGGSDLLGGLLRGAIAKQMAGAMGGSGGAGGGIGGLLSGLLGGGQDEPEPQVTDTQRQLVNDQATLLIRAMCNAAKADGQVDRQEQQKIIGRMGELDQNEIEFLQKEFAAPLDVNGFARSVPREMAPQVYALSVMTVKVDTRQEVKYLTQLAQGLGLDQKTVDAIHQQAA